MIPGDSGFVFWFWWFWVFLELFVTLPPLGWIRVIPGHSGWFRVNPGELLLWVCVCFECVWWVCLLSVCVFALGLFCAIILCDPPLFCAIILCVTPYLFIHIYWIPRLVGWPSERIKHKVKVEVIPKASIDSLVANTSHIIFECDASGRLGCARCISSSKRQDPALRQDLTLYSGNNVMLLLQ